MSKKISVVISSLRQDRLELTIDNIEPSKELVEVVVVSPFVPRKRDFVLHVPVAAPGEKGELSFTQKFNLGVNAANGEYIVYNNDDLRFVEKEWAITLIEFMQQNTERPFLACFDCSSNGVVYQRHTLFGLLYANHGCIRKSDLELIGGKLFDDKLFMYYSDGDLGLRVWSAGGRVSNCLGVTLNVDDDDTTPIKQSSIFFKDKKAVSYRDTWFTHDVQIFYRKWFKKYFWMMFSHYETLKNLWTNSDGVLSPKQYEWSKWRIFIPQMIQLYFYMITFQSKHIERIKVQLCRLINRRWGSSSYQVPYKSEEITRNLG